jgi:hypothetical protein
MRRFEAFFKKNLACGRRRAKKSRPGGRAALKGRPFDEFEAMLPSAYD